MISIEWIKKKITNENYFLSGHADAERKNDNLTLAEIEEALLNGMILESYSEDRRGESCLIVGFTASGKPIHVVCGKSHEALIVITVYIPTPPKFKNPYERG